MEENKSIQEKEETKKKGLGWPAFFVILSVMLFGLSFYFFFSSKELEEETVQNQEQTAEMKQEADTIYGEIEKLNVQIKEADAQVTELQTAIEAAKAESNALQKETEALQKAKSMQYPVTLSSFHTTFSTGGGRGENIRISTESVNGVVLLPGETISFNTITGPRSKANGYKTATVIVNGKYTDGIGGGVCQTSSTLFNAALLANLEIVERHNHGLRSSYVPAGRDATVADGYLDLKIKNPYDHPIKIQATAASGICQFSILGVAGSEIPRVDLKVSSQNGKTYTLKRIVNGSTNYTTRSTYKD